MVFSSYIIIVSKKEVHPSGRTPLLIHLSDHEKFLQMGAG